MLTLGAREAQAWLDLFGQTVDDELELLTELDRRCGDGDFGANLASALRRALHATHTSRPETPGEVFSHARDAFLNTGGTSGPLFGLWFSHLASLPGDTSSAQQLAAAVQEATAAVQRLGGAEVGHKTMVDAMAPAAEALVSAAARGGSLAASLEATARASADGAESTRAMIGRRGRASYVGEHARGVVDPGAKTVAMFFAAGAELSKAAVL